ncbi:amino acid adenylation domain-containing protein [Clostridium sp. CF011]|uniref:non-ribosomal peptide synthetase n=1 Tax=Clostridium sp. CF011 TaxID=2843318 RepID=UPI001C0BBA09|nr:non-ribosomal peptide synthetase [Clostridium sp. CF011]MBU3090546.1 amino acid adenylation domain-containing protein [Clostridium sp. CF011]WAG69906.1 amino acid adenylation domain-containing protein [Clostridium sp. CF011]
MKEEIKYLIQCASKNILDKRMVAKIISIMSSASSEKNEQFAIVGISANMPRAEDKNKFWDVIANSTDCIVDFPKDRMDFAKKYLNYIGFDDDVIFAKGGYLEGIENFDYSFFGITPAEAKLMDPNQRLFLQEAFNCLEDAGYGNKVLSGKNVGVFVGYDNSTVNEYRQIISDVSPEALTLALAGNIVPAIASRISHILDFHGPAMVIDTACSSALLAVHMACMCIQSNQCQSAVVGSVKLSMLPIVIGEKLGVEAGDWKTKAFDDSADGTGVGEGVGAIFIKPLKKAIKDGDDIYAVIKGGVSNHDGNSIGLTAPNPLAQEKAILGAWENAGVKGDTISYIEAHGTGTKIGDPIEIQGLTKSFLKYTDKKQFCAIGSVKTNIGHLDHASGIASIIKVALALKKRKLPPTCNFKSPNRIINFINSPFYVNTKLREWECGETPLRCGINSFGLSGTNVHLVLEEAPKKQNYNNSGISVLVLSAKSEFSLKKYLGSMRIFLEETQENFNDICYTTNCCRGHYTYRVAIVADSCMDAAKKINYLEMEKDLVTQGEQIYYGIEDQTKYKKELIDEDILQTTDDIKKNMLSDLAKKYCTGIEINWDKLYEKPSRVHLPPYPFDMKKCVIEIPYVDKDISKVRKEIYEKSEKNILVIGNYSGVSEEVVSIVANTWGNVLGIDEVNVNDNLFKLGGDSIFAMKVFNILKNLIGEKVEIKDIMGSGDFITLAKTMESKFDNKNIGVISHNKINEHSSINEYKLTPQQERLFLINLMDSDSKAYNMPTVMIIEGKIDINKLENSFKKLIASQESLRTSFNENNGQVFAKINNNVDFSLEIIECNNGDYDSAIEEFIKPFDFNKAPLLRNGIIKVFENKHLLLFDIHHIICDGMSITILIEELMKFYIGDNERATKLKYSDYAIALNKKNETGDYKKQEEFWKKQLSGKITRLNMPNTKIRPQVQQFEGLRISKDLSKELTESIKDLAKNNLTTTYNVLFAALNIMIKKYTDQDDIIIGSPVSGRNDSQLNNIIGLFVNTVVMRNEVVGEDTVLDLINKIKNNTISVYENQEFPFDKMVELLDLPRDLSRNPIFDVMFSMQNFSQASMDIKELTISPYAFENKVSKVDITVNAIEKSDIINLEIEFSTALFERKTIERMMGNLFNILDEMVKKPETTIDKLDMLTKEELKELKVFGTCMTSYNETLTIDRLIETQVNLTPNKVALIINDEKISYIELNERANSLGNELLLRGVDKSGFIAIVAERSIEMIVALLAIIKIGAAYVPIDPYYPKKRIEFMIKDSGATSVLHYCSDKSIIINFANSIDLSKENNYSNNFNSPNVSIDENSPMYMIYTSGSTGVPKGVILTHKNVNNFINGITRIIDINENNKILSVTTFGFDIFVLESFLMLSKGATIVLASDEQINSPQLLCQLIDKNDVNILQATPLRMKLILNEENSTAFRKLRTILIGGEAFPLELLKKLNKYDKLRIYNMYGPTETTVWSTVKELTNLDYITVGKPIANTNCCIVDTKNKLVPIGSVGELIIGGDGISKGYHNRSQLNKDRFIHMDSHSFGMMYKTGDTARWRNDGEIEVLGRNDNMFKINGYRIELGEIQSCIAQHGAIKEVGVVTDDKDYILAYYVENFKVSSKEIRDYVSNKLPNYMIPNKFITLNSLPHTPNGKLDLKVLKSMKVEGEEINKKSILPPNNKLQKLLVDSWKRVLEVDEVSVDDNFFELGGNSMKVIMFIADMKKFNIDIIINNVFSHNTILDLEYYLNSLVKKNLISNGTEVKKKIFETLNLNINIVETIIDNEQYIIYCVDDYSEDNKQKLLEALNKYVDKEIYPHYIISSDKALALGIDSFEGERIININLNDFESNLHMLKINCETIINEINNKHKEFEKAVLIGEVEKEYRLAPIQYFFLDSERYSGTLLHFDDVLNIDIFNKAIQALLINQGIFRSTLVKRNDILFWSQHELINNVQAPYIDISNVTKESKVNLMRNIASDYYFKSYEQISRCVHNTANSNDENSLLYRTLLVKSTERDFYLFLPVNHAIFDAMSGEIVKGSINEFYNRILDGEVIGMENSNQYQNFIEQIRKGPVNISDEELVKKLEVGKYVQYTNLLNEKINKYNRDKSTYIKFEIEKQEGVSEDNAWEVAFEVLNIFIQDYMGVKNLPIMFYYYGRNYENKGYFDTVGEFIDMIPVFIDGKLELSNMVQVTQDAIALSETHNINFSNLATNKSQQVRTPKICRFVTETNEKSSIVFNFQGKLEEKEMKLFEDVLYERLMHELNMEESVNIHFMTRYSNNKIQVDINIPFDTQDNTIIEFFKSNIENIKECKEIKYGK